MLGALFGWRLSFAVSAVLAALLVVALVRLLPAIRPEPSSGLKHVLSVLKLPNVQLGLVAVALIFYRAVLCLHLCRRLFERGERR